MPTQKLENLYQIKVQLKNFKPSMYRTFLVSENDNFLKLHNHIQYTFGLYDYHLWHFYTSDRQLEIITKYDDFEPFFLKTKSPRTTKLKDIFGGNGYKKINYEYDFGDSWEFSVELQKIIPYNGDMKYPQLLKLKGGIIIEDCGGPWGLQELVEDYKNKKHNTDFFGTWEEFEEYVAPHFEKIDISDFKL